MAQDFRNVKILIGLPDRERCVRSQEFVAEDLCEEDIVGLVLGFELVTTDGAVVEEEGRDRGVFFVGG
jgi:hypothetical protein